MTRFALVTALVVAGSCSALAQTKEAAPATPTSNDASVGTPAPPASSMNGEAAAPEAGRQGGAGGGENHNPGKSPLTVGKP